MIFLLALLGIFVLRLVTNAVVLGSAFATDIDAIGNPRLKALGNSGRSIVATSATDGYWFHCNNDEDLAYSKTTNGGRSWSAGTTVVATITIEIFCVWFDKWTPGDSGTKIHVWYIDAGADDVVYANLDTATDTWSTPVVVSARASSTTAATMSATKTRGGNLLVVYNIDGGTERGFSRSTDGGATWGARADPTEAAADQYQLFPGNYADNQDADLIFWDLSANEISIKVYDDSADSWAETSIATGMISQSPLNTCNPQFAGAIRHSDGHLILAAWSDRAATAALKTWDINGSGSITAKANVLTDATNCQCVGVQIDQSNDKLYCFYLGREDESAVLGFAIGISRKESDDGGATWVNEQFMLDFVADISVLACDLGGDGTFRVAGALRFYEQSAGNCCLYNTKEVDIGGAGGGAWAYIG